MKEKTKLGLGSAIGGAIILSIIGFSWGGWVTESTANKMIEDTVVDRLASICVAQFQQDPDREVRLKELKELDFWKRSDYVKERGWATMPGDESPESKVTDECVRQLMEFAK